MWWKTLVSACTPLASLPSPPHSVRRAVDSGLTLMTLRNMLLERGALSVTLCTLLDKKARRKHVVEALRYVGACAPRCWQGLPHAADLCFGVLLLSALSPVAEQPLTCCCPAACRL